MLKNKMPEDSSLQNLVDSIPQIKDSMQGQFYFDNFAYKIDPEDKKWKRYVSNSKKNIMKQLQEKGLNSTFREDQKSVDPNTNGAISSLEMYVMVVVMSTLAYQNKSITEKDFDKECDEFDIGYNFKDRFPKKYCIPYELIKNKNFIDNLQSLLVQKNHGMTLSEILDTEINNSIKHYLMNSLLDNPKIDSETYIMFAPRKFSDCINIFEEICYSFGVDIERLMNENVGYEDIFNAEMQESIKKLNDSIQEKEKIIEDLTATIKRQKQQIETLTSRIEKNDGTVKDALIAVELENQKLKKLYNALLERYNNLTESISEEETIVQSNDEELPDLDLNGHYVFVIYKDDPMISVLKQHFPNSEVYNGENHRNADIVVALTQYLGHSDYYDSKNKCKIDNVPYVHCSSKNMKLIEKAIQNALYKKD